MITTSDIAISYTKTVITEIKCELCGLVNKTDDESDWSDSAYDVNSTTLRMRVGSSYPEGGNTEVTILDICPDCFQNKLIPWFVSQSGSVRHKTEDW